MNRHVTKRDGNLVPFDQSLLERSLKKAGASSGSIQKIVDQVSQDIQEGETTDSIYKKAFLLLNSFERPAAIRYSLRRALVGLGPTGFPFEKFIGVLFSRMGYAVKTNINLRGHCVIHEVDVHATKGKKKIAIEAKFQNDPQGRLDLKVALYVKARFDDLIKKGWHERWSKDLVDECILVTNGKFTSNAIHYAECSGVTLLGWGYPHDNNLQTMITKVNAHPITCLPSLSRQSARMLFDMKITTCRDFLDKVSTLEHTPIHHLDILIDEAKMLCVPERRGV